MTRRDFTVNDIHLALDGELSADERADFERWLELHPEMQVLSDRFAQDRATLVGALGTVLEEPVPARLTKIATGEQRPRRSWGVIVRSAAAAAVLLAIGAGGGYGIGVSGLPGETLEERIVGDAIVAHRMYSAEKLHVVEVGADQQDHLIGWLSKRVGTQLVAADFSAQGFQLVGGRLLPLAELPSAQLMYQDQSGNRVSLYIIIDKDGADTGFRRYAEGGLSALYWVEKGYCYAVTGAASDDTLTAIANAAYRQLLDGKSV